MLVEFDLLIAVAAMMLLLPVAIFQILSSQSTFSKSSILFSGGLIANADTQRGFCSCSAERARNPPISRN